MLPVQNNELYFNMLTVLTDIDFHLAIVCSAIQKSLPVGVGTLEKDLVGRIDKIPDKHLTATSYKPNHEASLGRLGNSRVWCAENGKERYESSSLSPSLSLSWTCYCNIIIPLYKHAPLLLHHHRDKYR